MAEPEAPATDDPTDTTATPAAKKKAANRQKIMVGVGIAGLAVTVLILRSSSGSSSDDTTDDGTDSGTYDPDAFAGTGDYGDSDDYDSSAINTLQNTDDSLSTDITGLTSQISSLTTQDQTITAQLTALTGKVAAIPKATTSTPATKTATTTSTAKTSTASKVAGWVTGEKTTIDGAIVGLDSEGNLVQFNSAGKVTGEALAGKTWSVGGKNGATGAAETLHLQRGPGNSIQQLDSSGKVIGTYNL